jgi:predicted nucleic acid-binding protein
VIQPAFLIDTDWVIDHLKGRSAVTRRLHELQPGGLALSVVSVAELWEGVFFSLLIAASALCHNLTLLTNNRRHFEQIGELRIESLRG